MDPAATLRRWADAWMERRHGRSDGLTVLRYRRVYILPSRTGMIFALMLVAMWLGAINYGNSMAFLLTFLLCGLFLTAMNHTFRNIVGLRVAPGRPEPVFAGETALFPLFLENRRRGARYDIVAGVPRPDHSVDIAPNTVARVDIPVPAPRRGHLLPGRIVIETRYPGALFRAWSWVRPGLRCVVYPAPEPGPGVPAPGRTGGRSHSGSQDPGDEDFRGLRPYRPGDPIRRITWKSARGLDPQVKLFTSDAPDRLWLTWEATASLGRTEARLSRLCRWVLDANREGRLYGLEMPDRRIAPGTGETHMRLCLTTLAEHPA